MKPSNFYTGTCGWNRDDWVGSFYPEFTQRENYLEIYSQHFSAVEVESTAYRLPPGEAFRRWRSRTPDGFKFALVAPRSITHDKLLSDAGSDLSYFLSLCEMLGGKLGPIIFEMPHDLGIEHLPVMTSFIKSLPKGFSFVFELRRKEWMTGLFIEHLKEYKVSIAQTDAPWMDSTYATASWSPLVYMRFRGAFGRNWKNRNANSESTSQEISDNVMKRWGPRAARIVSAGKPVYAFFSDNYSGHAPDSTDEFTNVVNGYLAG